MGSHDLKLLKEWETFARFCETAELDVDVGEVEMLDPNSSHPAPPDMKCWHRGEPLYVELGEVIQENFAERLAIDGTRATPRRRENEQPTVHTFQPAISPAEAKRRQVKLQPLPLLQAWAPLGELLIKKLSKQYDPEARPLALLLYYSAVGPFWEHVEPLMVQHRVVFQQMLERSPFDHVWIFDERNAEVLFAFSRPALLVSP